MPEAKKQEESSVVDHDTADGYDIMVSSKKRPDPKKGQTIED